MSHYAYIPITEPKDVIFSACLCSHISVILPFFALSNDMRNSIFYFCVER